MEGLVLNPLQWVEGQVGVHPCVDAVIELVLRSVPDPQDLLLLPVSLLVVCLSFALLCPTTPRVLAWAVPYPVQMDLGRTS